MEKNYIDAYEYMKTHGSSMKLEVLEEIKAQCYACLGAYSKDLTQEEIDHLLDTLNLANKNIGKNTK